MSFDRPGLPHPGHELDATVDETLREEGVELHNHEADIPDHPGAPSAGPQPNPPRRPPHEAAAETAPESAPESEASPEGG